MLRDGGVFIHPDLLHEGITPSHAQGAHKGEILSLFLNSEAVFIINCALRSVRFPRFFPIVKNTMLLTGNFINYRKIFKLLGTTYSFKVFVLNVVFLP